VLAPAVVLPLSLFGGASVTGKRLLPNACVRGRARRPEFRRVDEAEGRRRRESAADEVDGANGSDGGTSRIGDGRRPVGVETGPLAGGGMGSRERRGMALCTRDDDDDDGFEGCSMACQWHKTGSCVRRMEL